MQPLGSTLPMNDLLTIDLSNTRPNAALFHKEQIQEIYPWNHAQKLIHQYPFILSTVQGPLPPPLASHPHRIPWKPWSPPNPFENMPVHYEATLGQDRLVQAAYLYNTPACAQGLLLIDAGTFITLDYINPDGFLGGHILPGPKLLLKAYSQGHQLPLLDIKSIGPIENLLPQTTSKAIASSIYYLLKNFIEDLSQKLSYNHIFLTGGDAFLLKPILKPLKKNLYFEPQLIHKALYNLAKENS